MYLFGDFDRALFRRAECAWGINAQYQMLVEEATELALATLKFMRHSGSGTTTIDLIDEMADVEIMIAQVRELHDGDNWLGKAVDERIVYKLIRLANRLEKE